MERQKKKKILKFIRICVAARPGTRLWRLNASRFFYHSLSDYLKEKKLTKENHQIKITTNSSRRLNFSFTFQDYRRRKVFFYFFHSLKHFSFSQ